MAYADPPYPGCAHLYGRKHDVNHEVLIGTLIADYDCWALSTSSSALRTLLPLCPENVRVAAWCKPFAAWKKGVVPPFAWEPVLFVARPGRTLTKGKSATLGKPTDWIAEMPPIFVGENRGLKGVKPLRLCLWILDMLGYRQDEDTLDDMFPGSGIMAEAVDLYGRQREMFCGDAA